MLSGYKVPLKGMNSCFPSQQSNVFSTSSTHFPHKKPKNSSEALILKVHFENNLPNSQDNPAQWQQNHSHLVVEEVTTVMLKILMLFFPDIQDHRHSKLKYLVINYVMTSTNL